jgi:hypothetical protein
MPSQNRYNLRNLHQWRPQDTISAHQMATQAQQDSSLRRWPQLTVYPYSPGDVPLAVAMYQALYQANRQDLWQPIQAGLIASGVFPILGNGQPDAYTVARARVGDFSSLFRHSSMPRRRAPRYLPHVQHQESPYFAERQDSDHLPMGEQSQAQFSPPSPPPSFRPRQTSWEPPRSQNILNPRGASNSTLAAQRASSLAYAALRGSTGAINMIQRVRKMAQAGNPLAQQLFSQIQSIMNVGGPNPNR